MRKVYVILCLAILISILSGCVTGEATIDRTKNQLILSNDNNFRLELLEYINEYKILLELIVEHQEKSSFDYLEGRIDGFLSRKNQTISSILNKENIDEATLNAIVRNELQNPLSQFVGFMGNSIKDIKKKGVDRLTNSDLEKYEIVLSKLVVFNHSASDIYTDEISSKEIQNAIESIIDLY